jgi:membrane protein DedA with SNARE-associated domain
MNFESILFYLTSQGAIFILAIVFVSSIIENLFPPFPGDFIILAGAYLAGRGEVHYLAVYAFAVAGGLAGAMILYYLGRWKGRSLFIRYDKYYLKVENLTKIERWFKRWGVLVLIFSRFIAGARSVIAIAAGIGEVPVRQMTIFTFISFCLWNGLLIGGMYLLKSNWVKLVHIIKSYNMILVIASAILLLGWLVIVYRRSITRV